MTLEEALAAIQRIRELHTPGKLVDVWGSARSNPDDHLVCEECTDPDAAYYVSWPCPTVAALDGTEPAE